jgi:hypothetical protein
LMWNIYEISYNVDDSKNNFTNVMLQKKILNYMRYHIQWGSVNHVISLEGSDCDSGYFRIKLFLFKMLQ